MLVERLGVGGMPPGSLPTANSIFSPPSSPRAQKVKLYTEVNSPAAGTLMPQVSPSFPTFSFCDSQPYGHHMTPPQPLPLKIYLHRRQSDPVWQLSGRSVKLIISVGVIPFL